MRNKLWAINVDKYEYSSGVRIVNCECELETMESVTLSKHVCHTLNGPCTAKNTNTKTSIMHSSS